MLIRKAPSSRRRRTPEASRDNILTAAESLLEENGPQALRLADVARRAGVANATVLHHFGSIDSVQTALMERMIADIVSGLLELDMPSDPEGARRAGLQHLFEAFARKGTARLAAWLVLTDEARRLQTVREAVATVIRRRMDAGQLPLEQMEDMVLLSILLAAGAGLFGPTLDELLGRPAGHARMMALALLTKRLQPD